MKNPEIDNLAKFIDAFRARMLYSETNGGDYKAVQKTTKALGKYQFVPSIWWNTKKGIGGIKQYAAKNGWEEVAKKSGYDGVTQDFYLNTPELQEEFFNYYAEKQVYPNVLKINENNPRNLSVDEIAQLYHLSPKDTINYVKGGKWDPPGKQTPLKEYLRKGKLGIEKEGLSSVSTADVIPGETRKEKIDHYFSEIKGINSKDYSPTVKNSLIKNLQQQYKKEGLIPYINEEVKNQRESNQSEFNTSKENFELFYDVFSSGRNDADLNVNRGGPRKGSRYRIDVKIKNDKDFEIIKNLKKSNPELFEGNFYNEKKRKFSFIPSEKTPMGQYFIEGIERFAGTKITDESGKLKITSLYNDEGVEIDDNILSRLLVPGLSQYKKDFKNPSGKKIPVLERPTLIGGPDDELKKLSFDKTFTQPSTLDFINPDSIPDPVVKSFAQELPKTDKQASLPASKGGSIDSSENPSTEEQENNELDKYRNFLSFNQELEEPNNLEYDKKDYKAELPFEAISAGLLGAIGLNAADNEIPKRNEQVSAAMLDYTAKLSELSRVGLPAEVEAKAKSDLSAAYQLGIKNIVNASAGNRNLVLGNQGQIDLANLSAISEYNVQEAKAKNEALYRYGEAVKYINQVDLNRDIANKNLEQRIALNDRQAGGDLAAAGFSSMIDSIQNQKENGPGSSRHMLKSLWSQNAFGYDPEMIDDGSGSKKGTKSHYEKNVLGKIRDYNSQVQEFESITSGFDDEKKSLLGEFTQSTQDIGVLNNIAKNIKDKDISQVNRDFMPDVISQGDYSRFLGTQPLEPIEPKGLDFQGNASILSEQDINVRTPEKEKSFRLSTL